MKGEDSLARDGVTVDRLLPLLHCPKPEMGEEDILYSSTNPGEYILRETRKSPVSTSTLHPTDQFIGGTAGRPIAEPPPRPVHLPTHVSKTEAK